MTIDGAYGEGAGGRCPVEGVGAVRAAEQLAVELKSIRFADPVPPVVTNVEALPNHSGARVPGLLEQQVTAPVRFTEMIQRMRELGVNRFLEVGPGRVLTGLVGRIAARVARASVGCQSDLAAAVEFAAGTRA